MKHRLLAILSVLILASLACQGLSPGGDTTQPVEESNVLFQDDFSDPGSGWDRVDVADGITDYDNGIYRIYVNTENTDVWANPGLNFSDVHIEVDATKIAGDDNNDFGIVCRYQDNSNFYFFIISSDGFYGVGKVVDGVQNLIGVESMPPSDKINQGNASNHLRADCVGSQLSIHVNGELLDTFEDSDFTSGDVGLLAGSFAVPGTDVHFDNFVVLKP
jgi:hypothetical protein